jgi:hypothetical protein
MRKAVTFLQSCHQLTVGKSDVTPSIVNDVSGNVSRHFLHFLTNNLTGFCIKDSERRLAQTVVFLVTVWL